MPATDTFNRDLMARWYAREHRKTDPGVVEVYHLPTNADEREIRLLEVNKLIGDRTDDSLEPVDFGIDRGKDGEHRLLLLDVTPAQWRRIKSGKVALPDDWSLEGAVRIPPRR